MNATIILTFVQTKQLASTQSALTCASVLMDTQEMVMIVLVS